MISKIGNLTHSNKATSRGMEQISKASDEALMHRLSQGEMSCAAHLFERYHRKLYNFFLRLTTDRSLSEDLTQTVFERLIRYRQSYVEGSSFRSWVYQIARNARIDYYKKKRPMSTDLSEEEVLPGSEVSASRRMEEREEQQRLHHALRKLSEDQREVLILARFQQLKYREVAELMGTTEGAVKVRVHRAIKELRDIYLKMEGA